jgi:hypothetical protein
MQFGGLRNGPNSTIITRQKKAAYSVTTLRQTKTDPNLRNFLLLIKAADPRPAAGLSPEERFQINTDN